MNGNVFGMKVSGLVCLFMTFAISIAMVGCGGADQTTGSAVKVDEGAAKRQDDMTKFYESNPLPKPKKAR